VLVQNVQKLMQERTGVFPNIKRLAERSFIIMPWFVSAKLQESSVVKNLIRANLDVDADVESGSTLFAAETSVDSNIESESAIALWNRGRVRSEGTAGHFVDHLRGDEVAAHSTEHVEQGHQELVEHSHDLIEEAAGYFVERSGDRVAIATTVRLGSAIESSQESSFAAAVQATVASQTVEDTSEKTTLTIAANHIRESSQESSFATAVQATFASQTVEDTSKKATLTIAANHIRESSQ